MPVGRRLRLKPGEVQIDQEALESLLEKHKTGCESPECKLRPKSAFTFYHTTWSFAFLCETCFNKYNGATGGPKRRQDLALAEHMHDLMMHRSYVYMNTKSGFLLEEMILLRKEIERKINRIEQQSASAERSELRKQIRESKTTIGAPDDELLVAREREELRRRMGLPTTARLRTDRTAPLRAKLIVNVQLRKENNDSASGGVE